MKTAAVVMASLLLSGCATLSKILGGPSSVEELVDGAAITTSLADARTELASLDGYWPASVSPLESLPRSPTGGFLLVRPGAFEMALQSYCLHAGTYAPSQGDGYLYAPLKGPRSEVIRHILQRSVQHPEVPQHSIQTLIWAILARTRIKDMPLQMQVAALQLLTPEELFEINGGAAGLVPQFVMDRLTDQLPGPVRDALRAEAQLRRMLLDTRSTYEDLERVAVLIGNAPLGPGSRTVSSGRWSYHPRGLFVHYVPSGYSKTQQQVVVPAPVPFEKDARGRIVSIHDSGGDRLEVRYDDSKAPFPVQADPGVQGHAFAWVRVIRHVVHLPEITSEVTSQSGPGWTLVGVPSGSGQGGPAPDLAQRYARAVAQRRELESLGARKPIPPELLALGQLEVALEGAIDPRSGAGDLVWRAWMFAVCQYQGGCAAPAGKPLEYDPSADVAAPGNTARQRLAQSGRPLAPGKGECDAVRQVRDEQQLIRGIYADPQGFRYATAERWTGQQYQEAVNKRIDELGQQQGNGAVTQRILDANPGLPLKPPMSTTSPPSCRLVVDWPKSAFQRAGLPDIIYDALYEHEQVHVRQCEGWKGSSRIAERNRPDTISREEVAAYDRSLAMLDDWLQRNCR